MIKVAVLAVLLTTFQYYFFNVFIEVDNLNQKLLGVNHTLVLDYVQQRALYRECMEITYHVPAGRPVDRRLLE